jgi:DNA-binding NarL/FixJ family response regulator
MDGVESTAALLDAYPGAAVIGLTASANIRERQALRDAGAVACLSKDDDLEEIVAAIRGAAGMTPAG